MPAERLQSACLVDPGAVSNMRKSHSSGSSPHAAIVCPRWKMQSVRKTELSAAAYEPISNCVGNCRGATLVLLVLSRVKERRILGDESVRHVIPPPRRSLPIVPRRPVRVKPSSTLVLSSEL